MGRYIRGDAGFQYKYLYAEQPANLTHLAEASGVGRSGLLPAQRGAIPRIYISTIS
jgi:hypothetical protein